MGPQCICLHTNNSNAARESVCVCVCARARGRVQIPDDWFKGQRGTTKPQGLHSLSLFLPFLAFSLGGMCLSPQHEFMRDLRGCWEQLWFEWILLRISVQTSPLAGAGKQHFPVGGGGGFPWWWPVQLNSPSLGKAMSWHGRRHIHVPLKINNKLTSMSASKRHLWPLPQVLISFCFGVFLTFYCGWFWYPKGIPGRCPLKNFSPSVNLCPRSFPHSLREWPFFSPLIQQEAWKLVFIANVSGMGSPIKTKQTPPN